MAQVGITVNGRRYRLGCREGEEPRLQELARTVDRHIKELADEFGPIGDERLLIMSALMVADELFEAHAEITALQERLVILEPRQDSGAGAGRDAREIFDPADDGGTEGDAALLQAEIVEPQAAECGPESAGQFSSAASEFATDGAASQEIGLQSPAAASAPTYRTADGSISPFEADDADPEAEILDLTNAKAG